MPAPEDIDEPFRKALLKTVPCALFILDSDERTLYRNRSAEDLTGTGQGKPS